jgi:hypothetical protein
VLSHFTARGETLLFIDGKQTGRVAERLEPKSFVVGGSGTGGARGPKQADYKTYSCIARRSTPTKRRR